jgi:hypothetical protein
MTRTGMLPTLAFSPGALLDVPIPATKCPGRASGRGVLFAGAVLEQDAVSSKCHPALRKTAAFLADWLTR